MLKSRAIGRLVADPTIREIVKNETVYPVCEFRMACQDGKDKVDYIKVTAWRGMGNFIFNNVKKGQKIYIEGKLKIPPFNKERGNAYEPYIVAFDFEFCDSKKKEVNEEANTSVVSAGYPTDDELYETLSEDELM